MGLNGRFRVVNLTRTTYLYVDGMTEKRQSAAAQQGPGTNSMAIGEFGGAATLPGDGGAFLATPMYWLYEMGHAALDPARAFADATRLFFKNPANPLAHTTYGKSVAAAMELFERSTRRYGRPDWRIDSTTVGGERVPVHIKTGLGAAVLPAAAFRARLRAPAAPAAAEAADRRADVGPLSRRCCAARSKPSCPITRSTSPTGAMRAWCRSSEGRFDLDDYIDYVISMLHSLGGDAM